MNCKEALLRHVKTHSRLMPNDIIKFLYQAEFGCGHLIPDYTDAHERFCNEWELAEDNCEELFEPLGGGFCRVNLGAAKACGVSQSMIMRMFFESAYVCGSKEHLCELLWQACESAESKELGVDPVALREAVEKFKAEGMPMLSHSAEYRESYRPSYRVIKAEFCFYFSLFKRIFEILPCNAAPLIVIDGMASAGKTTLASLISSIVPCNCVHADSFFLPPELRTNERFAQAGGRLHYERLREEVLEKLTCVEELSYRIFDCGKMEYTRHERIITGLPTVLEGSYSTHPMLNAKPDISVFLKTDPKVQAKRILHRNGKRLLQRFISEWIPAENSFFEQNNTESNCDFVFET